jgi:ribonuclease P protein subunit POP4
MVLKMTIKGEVTEKNIIQHEFIGLQAEIIDSPDPSLRGVSGVIIDETMNTFKLEYQTLKSLKEIIVQKNKNRFKFTLPVSRDVSNSKPVKFELDGAILTKRPEDRIKKLAKLANKMYRKNQH